MRRKIAVLLDETIPDRHLETYRIAWMARRWEKMGFEVVLSREVGAEIGADLVIPHLDRSVMPRRLQRRLADRDGVVNGRMTDIRRTSYSRNLLARGDTYDGPVLVKTNANYGGKPERKLISRLPRPRRLMTRAGANLRTALRAVRTRSFSKLAHTEFLEPREYPIFPNLCDVPREVFGNERLVVEKFLPERDGTDYVLRSYSFFGNAGFAVRTLGPNPIVKGATGTAPEFVEPHPDIVAARGRLGFEYGKFDYTVHDGAAVLFDVNWTQTFGPVFDEALRERMAARLAGGIRQWFPEV